MTLFRRRLRVVAIAWLLFQATSLSALVPRACCLAHEAALATAPTCHEMQTGQGHDHSAHQTQTPVHECAIRGMCGGPAAAMLTLLSTQGVLAASAGVRIDVPPAGAPIVSRDQLILQFEPPDAPPPRG
jgi:hypothetical protein